MFAYLLALTLVACDDQLELAAGNDSICSRMQCVDLRFNN